MQLDELYVLRLCYDRNPSLLGHAKSCMIYAYITYECTNYITIPFNINQVFPYRLGFASLTLLRTRERLADVTSVQLHLNCSKSCQTHSAKKSKLDEHKFDKLKIISLNMQNINHWNMISTKLKEGEMFYLQADIYYPFASEVAATDPIDMNMIRYSITCPTYSWIVLTFFCICMTFLLVAYLNIRLCSMQISIFIIQFILIISASANAIILFISLEFIFIVWIRDVNYVDTLGQRGRLLHLFFLTFLMILGLCLAINGVIAMNSTWTIPLTQLNNSSHVKGEHVVDQYVKCGGKYGLIATTISLFIFIIFQAILFFFGSRFPCLRNEFNRSDVRSVINRESKIHSSNSHVVGSIVRNVSTNNSHNKPFK